MQLSPIVEGISEDLRKAGAVGGEETRRVAELLVASVEAAVGLRLLDALHAAARELADSVPGVTVDVRLEGRDPVFSLALPPSDASADSEASPGDHMAGYADDDLARLTLRLPEGLKGEIEQVAVRAGASINSWIVSALARGIERPPTPQPGRRVPKRLSGYVQG